MSVITQIHQPRLVSKPVVAIMQLPFEARRVYELLVVGVAFIKNQPDREADVFSHEGDFLGTLEYIQIAYAINGFSKCGIKRDDFPNYPGTNCKIGLTYGGSYERLGWTSEYFQDIMELHRLAALDKLH